MTVFSFPAAVRQNGSRNHRGNLQQPGSAGYVQNPSIRATETAVRNRVFRGLTKREQSALR